MMRGKWVLAGGITVFATIAVAALILLRREAPARPKPPAQAPAANLPAQHLVLAGKIRARHVLRVPATTEGVIEVFHVDVGQEVYEGQLLARIKNAALESIRERAQADLERAQSRLTTLEGSLIAARLEASRAGADSSRSRSEFERAEKAYQRQELLHREGATPRLAFEKAQKELAEARAEFEILQKAAAQAEEHVAGLVKDIDVARKLLEARTQDLEHADLELQAEEVHAPADGLVVARHGEVGLEVDRLVADLFQIAVNLTQLDVAVDAEPPVLERLRAGTPAAIILAEFPGESIPGVVREIQGQQAIVEFESPDPVIRPGLTVQVRFKII